MNSYNLFANISIVPLESFRDSARTKWLLIFFLVVGGLLGSTGNAESVVNTYYDVSQPGAFSRVGNTVVTPEVNTDVEDRDARVLRVPDTSTVADVVNVLNEIGASPRDIIAILEALKRAGSLQADLEIM